MQLATAVPRLAGPPLVGHLLRFRRDRLSLLEELARAGDLVEFRMGPVPVLMVNARELAQEVLVERAADFRKSRGLSVFARPLLGNGLLTSEGEFHRRQRGLMAPAFHHKRLATYAETMAAATEQRIARWTPGARIDLAEEMMELTLAIVARTLFTADVASDTQEIGEALTVANRELIFQASGLVPPSWPTPSNRRMRAAVARLDAVVYRLIAERRAAPESDKGDVLSMLLAARDEADGSGMSDAEVRDEVMTLMLAGHETTANALAWAFHLLCTNPDSYERLRAEARTVLAGRSPALADLAALPYAAAVLRETLRLYPPAYMVGRRALWDLRLGHHRVREGAIVLVNIWSIHRRADYWDGPGEFRPERFLDGSDKELPRGTWLPFGGGPRVCIGNQFALFEGQLLLAAMAQRVRFELERAETSPEPLVTLRPMDGLPVRVV